MFRQIFRNHRFILLLIGCGLLAIAGYKWLSNSQPTAPKKMSIGTPNPREQAPDKGDRFPESARTAPARKPPVATRSRYAPQRLGPPEIPAEKRQRISELYDRHSPDRDNVNRDADWATAGPPREEVDILAEGLDTLSAAKFLKALGGYNKYAREYADKALAENPDDFEALLVWTQLRVDDEEREYGYRRLLEMDPNSITVLTGLGYLLANDAPEEAIEHLEKANSLDAAAGLYELGWAYQRVGEYDKAVAALKKAYQRYNQPRMLSEIRSIEAGTPQIPLIQRETVEGWQNETDTKSPNGSQRDSAPTAPVQTTEAAEDTSVEHHTREPSADEPGNQMDIQEFLEQMTDAEFSEFERFLAEESPEVLEFQNEVSLKPEFGERFSSERFKTAMEILGRYGLEEGLSRLKATDPEFAAEVERLIKPRRNTQEPPR